MRKLVLLLTLARLVIAPSSASAQISIGCTLPATLTAPVVFVSVNGACTDLSGFVTPLAGDRWNLLTRVNIAGATIDLSAVFIRDPSIAFTASTVNPSVGPTSYVFLFRTPIVPDFYSTALSAVSATVSSVGGTTTVANSNSYPTYLSGYGSLGNALTSLGIDLGTTTCVASGIGTSTTCDEGTKANSFAPTFYDNLEALLTYTQDGLGTATFTGRVTLDGQIPPVTTTPEPATLALFGSGLAAVGLLTRRRARRRG